jgi:hypothetical protein
MRGTDYRRRWLELRRSMRVEAELAEQDYGVDLAQRRYADLRAQNRGRAAVLRKLLQEK